MWFITDVGMLMYKVPVDLSIFRQSLVLFTFITGDTIVW